MIDSDEHDKHHTGEREKTPTGTYVSDLAHFLDSSGKLSGRAPMEVREMAGFLVLILDKVTIHFPDTSSGIGTGVRCRSRNCNGEIMGALDSIDSPVMWYCPECGNYGTISNWRGSQWDNTGIGGNP